MEPLRFRYNAPRALVRSANTVLNGRVRRYHDPGFCTTLSVKSVVRGEANYETRHSRYRVDATKAVVLEQGQEYALDIFPEHRTETLAIFFQPGFVEHVATALDQSPDQQLADPTPPVTDLEFCERSYEKTGRLGTALARLHRVVATAAVDELALEAPFFELAEALLETRADDHRQMSAMQPVRASTRAELYRRLHHARDYIESCFAEPLSVSELAAVACLSPYHFQRCFRDLFGVAPGQFVQRRRLRAAAEMLRSSGHSITQIANDVGYSSLGTFSSRFHRHFGMSPRQWRRGAN